MKQLFTNLNQEQQQAIADNNQLVLVKAGPGTGKTLTLVAKIKQLLLENVVPEKIIALTFTHRAAHEIKERLAEIVPDQFEQLTLGTFHSLAVKLLSIKPEQLLTDLQTQQLLKETIVKHKLDLSAKDFSLLISKLKNNQSLLKQVRPALVQAFHDYQASLELTGQLDYDDLLLQLLAWAQTQPIQQDQYLLVDEFQDVSPVQYQFVASCIPHFKQTFLIGDPKQAIYAFRGASSQSFSLLQQDFIDCSVHSLTKNYRSSQQILTVANRLYHDETSAQATTQEEGLAQLIRTYNQQTEADWVVHDIEQRLGGSGLINASNFHQQSGATFKELAVLYRIHQLGKVIEKKVKEVGFPYQKLGSESLYLQPVVALIIDFFKLTQCLVLGQDSADFWQKLINNSFLHLASNSVQKIKTYQQELGIEYQQALVQLSGQKLLVATDLNKLKFILETVEILTVNFKQSVTQLLSLIQEQLKNCQLDKLTAEQQDTWQQFAIELMQFANVENSITVFLDYYEKLKQSDFYTIEADKISLSSIHAAKGLEFDWVYLIGFEQDLMPLKSKKKRMVEIINSDEQTFLTEEKNLLYVALTRARKGVFLLTARQRWHKQQQASPFLALIKNDPLVEKEDEQTVRLMKKKLRQQEADRQASLF